MDRVTALAAAMSPGAGLVGVTLAVIVGTVIIWGVTRSARRKPVVDDRQRYQDAVADYGRRLNDPDIGMRLPALALLEDIAQTVPTCRPGVAQLLCAYLREPGRGDDEIVRRAVQDTLTEHLAPGEEGLWWGDLDLDLDGAELNNLDLSLTVVRRVSLRRAVLTGSTIMIGARVLRAASFRDAQFRGPALLDDVDFEQAAEFTDAWFGERMSLRRCLGRGSIDFAGARFGGPADFTGAMFLSTVVFSDRDQRPARFADVADFSRVRFAIACFDGVDFGAEVAFAGAAFIHLPSLEASIQPSRMLPEEPPDRLPMCPHKAAGVSPPGQGSHGRSGEVDHTGSGLFDW